MSCEKHPHRKRKDCSDCFPVTVGKPRKPVKIEKPVVIEKIKPSPVVEEKIETPSVPEESIQEIIQKELKKQFAKLIGETLTKEVIENAKKVAAEVLLKATESYEKKVKELGDVQYEHLAIPLSQFRYVMLDGLSKEGWKMVQMFTGDTAKVSGYKHDVIMFSRVKNLKWPKAPEFK